MSGGNHMVNVTGSVGSATVGASSAVSVGCGVLLLEVGLGEGLERASCATGDWFREQLVVSIMVPSRPKDAKTTQRATCLPSVMCCERWPMRLSIGFPMAVICRIDLIQSNVVIIA